MVMLLPDAHLPHSGSGQVHLPPLPSESRGVFSQSSFLSKLGASVFSEPSEREDSAA